MILPIVGRVEIFVGIINILSIVNVTEVIEVHNHLQELFLSSFFFLKEVTAMYFINIIKKKIPWLSSRS